MTDDRWSSVGDYGERVAADAILELLSREGLPCYVTSNAHVPGLGSAFSVRVPAPLLACARALLEHEEISDSELTELALREPPQDPGDA